MRRRPVRRPLSNAWLLALAAAVALFVYSRTRQGSAAVAEAVGAVVNAVRGLRNNNPGNLRANEFLGFAGLDADGYAIFDTLPRGVRAAARQLKLYAARGIDTAREIASTWAPKNENDTQAYVTYVAGFLGVGADVRLSSDEGTRLRLLRAIFNRELGRVASATISDAMILQGIRDA